MIDKKTVQKVADVARISLNEKELNKFSKDLENILKAFEDIQKLNTKNVQPTFQPIDVKNVTREDKIEPSLTQAEALRNTEQKEKGYFKGPKAV